MQTITKTTLPEIKTTLPGPQAKEVLNRDAKYISTSYTRSYPLVVQRGCGAILEDVDGARDILKRLADNGVSLFDVTYQLQVEGVSAFSDSFAGLISFTYPELIITTLIRQL